MAKYGLVHDTTGTIEKWTWETFNIHPMHMDLVFGIVETAPPNNLVGSALFWDFNGANVELNWYNLKHCGHIMTAGIAKSIATVCVKHFNVVRGTIRLPQNSPIIPRLTKWGFKLEGIEQHYFGVDKHSARLMILRAQLERIAGIRS